MATSTISHLELTRDFAAAEEATHAGPVLITTNGEPRSVLIDIAEYRKLSGTSLQSVGPAGPSMADLLAVPEHEYFDWEPPRLELTLRSAEFD